MSYQVIDNGITKIVTSDTYNMLFKRFKKIGNVIIPDGELLRWGKTVKDDPDFCPYGPEIADIEISSGKCSSNCPWCYKDNSSDKPLVNMSLDTYKSVLDKLCQGPKVDGVHTQTPLGQVALGLTSVRDNPDLIGILGYTLDKGCFPNFTISGGDRTLDLELAQDLAELCGALAVSVTPWNYKEAFDKVHLFTSLGVEQTNIHVVVSEDSMPFVHYLLDERQTNPKLSGMGAIVGLIVKPKGRAKGKYLPPSQKQYEELVHRVLKESIPIGFDSCSCASFLKSVQDYPNYKQLEINSDACESTLFSGYVNCNALFFPCSFAEGHKDWKEGIPILEYDDFVNDVWMHEKVAKFRSELVATAQKNDISCRECPIYPELLIRARQ